MPSVPLMQVRLDGQVLGTAMVSNVSAMQDHVLGAPTPIAPGAKIDVVFLNDAVTHVNGVREDRNLIVESVSADDRTPMKPTDPGVIIDQGSGGAAFDGLATVPGQQGIWWNGALRFTVPSGGDPGPAPIETVTMVSAATGGTANGPDGVVVRVPPGALATDTELHIARGTKDAPPLPAGMIAVSEIYRITPHTPTLGQPARIDLPFDSVPVSTNSRTPYFAIVQPGGQWEILLATQVNGSTASAATGHFSWVVVVLPPWAAAFNSNLVSVSVNLNTTPVTGTFLGAFAFAVLEPTTFDLKVNVSPGAFAAPGTAVPGRCSSDARIYVDVWQSPTGLWSLTRTKSVALGTVSVGGGSVQGPVFSIDTAQPPVASH